MAKRDPRVDAYIANAADFAKPLLTHFRAVVDEGCPDAEETIKWSTPSWQYAGSALCSMAAFKQHCSFGFWRANLLRLNGKPLGFGAEGQLSHVMSKKDLPPRPVFVALVKQADFRRKLATNKKARDTFDSFSPSQRREYVEWISEAKQEATRAKRLATSVEWLAEGKSRHWKYMT